MSQVERESMEVDVLFVGAGPATLASAIHLMNQVEAWNRDAEKAGRVPIEPPTVLVLEKSANVGDHMLSGGVMNPRAIRELVPDFEEQGFPTEYVCNYAGFWIFHPKGKLAFPQFATPPNFRKKGYHVVSLNKVAKWMGERAEAAGVEVYPGFAADQILVEGNRVIGVRTGDMGVDKDGKPKGTYQPGMDIHAKVTVLGEGVRGTLSKQLIERFDLHGQNPQTFETGVKEIWRINPDKHKPGRVVHGMSFPKILDGFHGMWLYDMQDNLVSYGFVTTLDSNDPHCDPHLEAQRFKTNPWMKWLLEDAELIRYGAKAIPTGGLYAQPKLYHDGALLVGDSASFCNAQNLAGIHMAMKSGMLAAETIVDGLVAGDLGAERLAGYERRVEESWIRDELWEVRNFHQAFDHGVLAGMFQAGIGMLTRGRGWGVFDRLRTEPGHERMERLDLPGEAPETPETVAYDGELTFDKLADVYNSGTAHEEDQPVHLLVHDTDVCIYQCAEQYGNPCQRFCPAAVYEMVDDPDSPTGRRLQINASNCVHCKTCDIMDPYQIITWVPPEGGGGPNYSRM